MFRFDNCHASYVLNLLPLEFSSRSYERYIYIGKERENLSTKRSDVLRRTADAFMRFESWTQAVHFLGYALFTQMFYIPLSKPTFRASAHLERLFIPSIVASSLSQVRITCPMFASSSKEERTNRSSIRSFIPWILWPISRRESFKFTNSSLGEEDPPCLVLQGEPLLLLLSLAKPSCGGFHRVSIFPIAALSSKCKFGWQGWASTCDRVPRLSFARRFFVFRPLRSARIRNFSGSGAKTGVAGVQFPSPPPL